MDLAHRVADLEAVVGKLHPPGLDLGEVEDVVDQLQEVLAAGVDVLQALVPLVLGELHQVVLEDLAEAQDGVERGAQLVAHVGQELALQPGDLGDVGVGDLQLAGAVGDLLDLAPLGGVEARVVDGDGRLVGDDLHERLLHGGEGVDLFAGHGQRSDQAPGRFQGQDQDRSGRVAHLEVLEAAVLGRVAHGDDLALLGRPANDALTQLESSHPADLLREGEGRDRRQGAVVVIEQKDRGRIAGCQVAGRLEHEIDGLLQLEAGREEVAHLAEEIDDYLIVHPRRV